MFSRRSLRVALIATLWMSAVVADGGEVVGGPEEASREGAVVAGRIIGLAPSESARIEVRRYGASTRLRYRLPGLWERDRQGHTLLWASGRASGKVLRVAWVDGGNAAYRFAGLPVGSYELAGVQDGRVVWRTTAVVHAEGQVVRADVHVPAGHLSLRARIRWSDGRPFRGIVVVEQPARGLVARPQLDGARELEADETGMIRVDRLHPGSCRLTALVPGTLRITGEALRLPYEGVHEWTLDDSSWQIGTVVGRRHGRPISGADVRVRADSSSMEGVWRVRTTSDANGRFRIPGGAYQVELGVVAAGHAPAWVKLGPAQLLGKVILDDRAVVEGFVRDVAGKPIADARVVAVPAWTFGGPADTVTVRTTEQGMYRLSVPPGESQLFVEGHDWSTPRSEAWRRRHFNPTAIQVVPGEALRRDLVVAPTARLRGQVVDVDGAPIAGAHVRLDGDGSPDVHTASDTDGRFELALAAGQPATLMIRRPGYLNADFWSLTSEETRRPLLLELERGVHFGVHVVTGRDSRSVVCARVQAYRPKVVERTSDPNAPTVVGPGETYIRRAYRSRSEYREYAPDAWTDASGWTRVGPMPVGEAVVIVEAPGFEARTEKLKVRRGTTAVIRLDPLATESRPTHTLQGRVFMPPGVQSERIDVRRTEPNQPLLGSWGDEGGIPVRIDSEGRFKIEGLEQGRIGLRATAWVEGRGYFGKTSAPAGASDVQLHLERATWMKQPPHTLLPDKTWTFRIVDPAGDPVERGTVTADVADVAGAQGSRSRKWSFRSGKLVVSLKADRKDPAFRFHAGRSDCGVWPRLSFVGLDPVRAGGPPIVVVIPYESPRKGIVVGPDGRGIRGVRIVHSSDVTSGAERSVLTGDDGSFLLGGLREDEPVVIRVEVPDWAARVPAIRLETWHSVYVVRLHRAVAPRLVVRDDAGRPLPGSEARIEPDGNDAYTFVDNRLHESFYSGPGWVIRQTDARGRLSFTRLDPLRAYTLRIDPPADRPDLAPFYDRSWRPTEEQEIRLTPWASVRGVVQDARGTPVAGAAIWARTPLFDYWAEAATSDVRGEFVLDRVPPGEVILVAVPKEVQPHFDRFNSAAVHTPTDGTRVVLLLAR